MRFIITLLFFVVYCFYAKAQLCEQRTFSNKFSIWPTNHEKPVLKSFPDISKKARPVIMLDQPTGSYKPNEKLPIFCELEYQLSRLIKRRVKFGVEPEQRQY